jgi:hypothetical protein
MYGDTEVMRKHAGRLREQGVDLRTLADRLVAQTESAGWAGRAADALAERIRERAAHLRDIAARHDGAAQAMDTHLLEVDRLKESIAEAEHRAADLASEARDRADLPPSGHKDWLTVDLRGH